MILALVNALRILYAIFVLALGDTLNVVNLKLNSESKCCERVHPMGFAWMMFLVSLCITFIPLVIVTQLFGERSPSVQHPHTQSILSEHSTVE